MEISEENMTQTEILEKMTELEYSLRQQRNLNAEMRHWLDIADDDIAQLRSENAALKKKVKDQVKTINLPEQGGTEPCQSPLANDLDAKRKSEKHIQRLEKESTKMKEQNKKLSAELKGLKLEREWDKINLSKSKFVAQAFEQCMEEARAGLLHMDEVIHQKNVKIKHLEETVEEYSNMTKELQLTNQELRKQLEEAQDEAIFNALNGRMEKEEGLLTSPLSFAEEMKLLASSLEVETSMSHYICVRHRETIDEEVMQHESLERDLQNRRCAGILETSLHRAVLFIFFIFIFTLLAFVASAGDARNYDLFSIETLWNSAYLLLQPYWSVHYGALPPV
ncbi:hypothetical protein Q5P01_008874 [Channa striata]|uniref:Uncharacterized protein n=1 Tax=Channa striata TaxID=64152 RepID=A0AA88N1H2_CHASR|nr:hypothetical protein Q5P01_008874 [Channa striata]